jgi:predicted TIM-barrel enzyme
MGAEQLTEPRRTFLAALRERADSGLAVLGAGAGTGLVARAAAHGGADFIAVYCTSRARAKGFPTSIIGDPNAITLELVREVTAVVGDVPVVAGLHATDPSRDIGRLLESYRELGCSGVINYPSMGLYGREYIGGPVNYDEGLRIERDALQAARDAGLASMTYIYRPEEADVLAAVSDVVVAHAGWTAGGLTGNPRSSSFEDAVATVEAQVVAARAANPAVLALGHGGPFSAPGDTAALYTVAGVVGFVGASSIERIPVERAVSTVVQEFRSVATAAASQEAGTR